MLFLAAYLYRHVKFLISTYPTIIAKKKTLLLNCMDKRYSFVHFSVSEFPALCFYAMPKNFLNCLPYQ